MEGLMKRNFFQRNDCHLLQRRTLYIMPSSCRGVYVSLFRGTLKELQNVGGKESEPKEGEEAWKSEDKKRYRNNRLYQEQYTIRLSRKHSEIDLNQRQFENSFSRHISICTFSVLLIDFTNESCLKTRQIHFLAGIKHSSDTSANVS